MNNTLWTDLYKPRKTTDLTCSIKTIQAIRNWINTWYSMKKKYMNVQKKKNEMNSCLLISGPTGVGKTVTTEVLINESKYKQYNLDLSVIKSKQMLDGIISNLIYTTDIDNIMNGKEQKKCILVVDGIEKITTPIEKKNIKTLHKDNNHKWILPIIFISNDRHNKLLSDFSNTCLKVKLYSPYESSMNEIMKRIMINEKMILESFETGEIIIDHAQSDIRRLIYILQELKLLFGNKKIKQDDVKEYCTMSMRKNLDVGLFQAAEKLMYNYESIESCMMLYGSAKSLLPLMIHENYQTTVLDKAKRTKITQLHTLKVMKKITHALSKSDVDENFVFSEQNWDMANIIGFRSCVEPSFYINKIGFNQNENKFVTFQFSTNLNRTYVKSINTNNIIKADLCFKNMKIFDYIYISMIIKKFIADNKIKKCAAIFRNYGLQLNNIESLLKIDKISGSESKNSKSSLTSKQRNEFTKYLRP
jgi:DNA polymerase III delta prime subunit